MPVWACIFPSHGTSGDHDGRVQRGGGAPTAADPGPARPGRAAGERPGRATPRRAARRVQAPPSPPRGRTRGGPRRREAPDLLAERTSAQADPRLGPELRAHVVRALRPARNRGEGAPGEGAHREGGWRWKKWRIAGGRVSRFPRKLRY